jgi:hypothetical protein
MVDTSQVQEVRQVQRVFLSNINFHEFNMYYS